jgi:hypothetical protein
MNYDIDCKKCEHNETDICDECSMNNEDTVCSCHINPPCSFCVGLLYEEKMEENK